MEQEIFGAIKLKYEGNMSYELSRPIPYRLRPLSERKTRWHEEAIYYDEKQQMIDCNGLHGRTAHGGVTSASHE